MATKKTTSTTKAKPKKTTSSAKSTTVAAATKAPATTSTPVVVTQAKGGYMDKVIPAMVFLLIIMSFLVGMLYGKLSVYEQGGAVAKAGTQPAQVGDTAPAAPQVIELDEASWNSIVDDAEFVMGDEDAEVTMVEFTDYQCPFCGRYFTETYGQIMQDYVDTGKVRYITRDLPLSFHANAENSALAARCAADQGSFFEMHDKLFETQAAWSNLPDPRDNFVTLAGDLGLNTSTFASCYDNQTHVEAIRSDLALAGQVGATGTPTFFINGKMLVGAQPYAAFQAEIDAALE